MNQGKFTVLELFSVQLALLAQTDSFQPCHFQSQQLPCSVPTHKIIKQQIKLKSRNHNSKGGKQFWIIL